VAGFLPSLPEGRLVATACLRPTARATWGTLPVDVGPKIQLTREAERIPAANFRWELLRRALPQLRGGCCTSVTQQRYQGTWPSTFCFFLIIPSFGEPGLNPPEAPFVFSRSLCPGPAKSGRGTFFCASSAQFNNKINPTQRTFPESRHQPTLSGTSSGSALNRPGNHPLRSLRTPPKIQEISTAVAWAYRFSGVADHPGPTFLGGDLRVRVKLDDNRKVQFFICNFHPERCSPRPL